jgi:uncharacterized membrane protein YhiD involved in acid resistance
MTTMREERVRLAGLWTAEAIRQTSELGYRSGLGMMPAALVLDISEMVVLAVQDLTDDEVRKLSALSDEVLTGFARSACHDRG